MKFGKLENVDGIDFTLRPPIFVSRDQATDANKMLYLQMGTTGWTHPEWKGSFYPSRLKSGEQLGAYAAQCNSIELNTTYYRIPPVDLIEKWISMVPADFMFCPKVLQYISHSRSLGTDTDRIDRFCRHLRHFRSHLGPVFLQLPPYFDTSRLPVLEHFLHVFPGDIRLSVELRHPSWFSHAHEFELLTSILLEQGRGLVITDVAGRRDAAHMVIPGKHVLVRFGGNDGHASDKKRLDAWTDIIKECIAHGIEEFYFFAHQPADSSVRTLHDMIYLAGSFLGNSRVQTRGPVPINDQQTLF